ncbi:hypothetical protein I553_7396 [Mycobacterium xenopi 4042]|uniref:Uncharacterized protein n=1 Tax=Mycobacterium xenopi 4042 TaxID=1299334 RepID=X8E6Q1_MYCXE|nr:hypothetical protein I553_7396 [Mycobacterium xenopi 4042]
MNTVAVATAAAPIAAFTAALVNFTLSPLDGAQLLFRRRARFGRTPPHATVHNRSTASSNTDGRSWSPSVQATGRGKFGWHCLELCGTRKAIAPVAPRKQRDPERPPKTIQALRAPGRQARNPDRSSRHPGTAFQSARAAYQSTP